MHEFILRGKKGCFVQIIIEEVLDFPNMTSHFGGYDARGTVEIKSGNYYVKGQLWFSTGEVYQFYEQLIRCMADLGGVAILMNSEMNLKLEVKFSKRGQVIIEGYFKEFAHEDNKLFVEIESNQSFFVETLDGLKHIINRYGDMKGLSLK